MGFRISQALYNLETAAAGEALRVRSNEAMAAAFGRVDLIVAATNPGPAFPAEAATSSNERTFLDTVRESEAAAWVLRGLLGGVRLAGAFAPRLPAAILDQVGKRFPALVNMGGLTIVSNVYGNPAVSIPAGTIDGLPVGVQVLARHHADALLLDVALDVERHHPWPLVAPPRA
jgi:aspartyl-tRNA(Asn)/glutamyl-tRNA(Gln) amidotransferase subunit A